MRIVVDTNVFVAALRNPLGASAEIIRRVRRKEVAMVASVPLMIEYEAVATRQEQLAAMGLSKEEVGAVLDVLALFIEPVEVHFLWRPILRDAGDDMVLEAAVNGRAPTLLTFNRRHFAAESEKFGIAVQTPHEFLRNS
jgi:putative PIN family toxin of toxin-antitoxin system